MVELHKNDIQAVSNDRFMRQYWKRLVLYMAIIIALLIGCGLLVQPGWGPAKSAALMSPGLIMYCAGAIWWIRSSSRAGRELVEQCKAGPITYKED